MKTAKMLSVLIILAVSGQALADVPPPLKPVEILEPDSVKTTPAPTNKPTAQPATQPATQPAPQPAKPAPVVSQPPVSKPTTQPTSKPAPVVVAPVSKPAPVVPAPVVTAPVSKPAPIAPTPVAKPEPAKPTTNPAPKPPPPIYKPAPPVYKPAPPLYQPPQEPQTVNTMGGFDVGQKIVTDTHTRGIIRAIFPATRTARVQFTYGTEEWPLSRLSREIRELGGFIVGQTVITDTRYKGVIGAIFADRTAQVNFSFGSENWPLSRLSVEIDEIGGFEVGQVVITDTHYRGKILQVFADRTATVQFNYGSENWPLSRLGVEVRTLMGFAVGDIAVTDTHYRGQIVQIFADRTALVRFNYGTESWPLARLGRAITSLKGFSVGQQVSTDTKYTGQILEIYSDSTASVRFSYGTENWPLSRLSNFYCPSSRCSR